MAGLINVAGWASADDGAGTVPPPYSVRRLGEACGKGVPLLLQSMNYNCLVQIYMMQEACLDNHVRNQLYFILKAPRR